MTKIVLLFAAAIVYSAVRYVVFAPKNLGNLPVFVVNKGVSMAAALAFSIAFITLWQRARRERLGQSTNNTIEPVAWFRAGVFGTIWHIPMSLAILEPTYFKEFFLSAEQGGRLNLNGEFVFMFGGLAAGSVYLLTRQTWSGIHRWWLSVAMMSVLLGHVAFMGSARGLNINASHAYLPPMWLLSLIGIALGLVFLLLSKPKAESSHHSRTTSV
jgi:hypothetical protein